jgi:hypothetical protein
VGCIGRRSPGRNGGRPAGEPACAPCGRGRWKIGCPGTGRPGAGLPWCGRAVPVFDAAGVAGRTGAVYTGRGPVCGTISRRGGACGMGFAGGCDVLAAGACGASAAGVSTLVSSVASDAAISFTVSAGGVDGAAACGGMTIRGACRGCGVINRGVGAGVDGVVDTSGLVSLSAGFGGSTAGRTGGATGADATGAAGVSAGGAAGFGGEAGLAATGTGDAGFAAIGGAGFTGAAGACFCRMAFSASPGLEMCEKSNFGLNSSSAAARLAADFEPPSPPPWRKWAFTFSDSSTLIELE